MLASDPRVAEADRAMAGADLASAERLLTAASLSAPSDVEILLKLAAVQRRAGRAGQALATIDRTLAAQPLNFTALLMRASLLDRLKRPGADEAWSHALAQLPSSELPHEMQAVVAKAQERVDAWVAGRDAKIRAAMVAAESVANEDERARIDRFRTNVLRRTRVYHCEPTHFHFPGLVEREFHPRAAFPWLPMLESATDVIAAELDAVMQAERTELVPYVQYAEHLPLDQWRELNQNPNWSAIHLLRHGEIVEANAAHCPRTVELLSQCAQPQIGGACPNAMFSLLAPNTTIPAHVGVQNSRLVCHLPLIVPTGCWLRVGAETRFWERGSAFVFDDTIEHEAANPTEDLRVVLIFDTWHPGLSPVEREAVKALIKADGIPGDRL